MRSGVQVVGSAGVCVCGDVVPGVRRATLGVGRSAGSGAPVMGCGASGVECGMWTVGCGMWTVGCETRGI